MKKFLYYSLIAAMTASSVALSSCDDEEEVDSIINNNSDNTQKDGTKFSVTVTLDNKTIFTQEGETGKSITLDLDKLAENPVAKEALKGYEILSFTKDGKEISGEQTITADAKYEINAIKIASLEYTLPEDGKLLYEKEVKESDDLKMKKGIRKIDIQEQPVDIQVEPTTYETWYYTTSNNQIVGVERIYRNGKYERPHYVNYSFDATTGKLYEGKYPEGYLFKAADKYYEAYNRYKKSKDGVKGYQTEWIYDEDANKSNKKEAVVEIEDEDEDEDKITFTADKVNYEGDDYDYKYQDGIITFTAKDHDGEEEEMKFIYDGTYLYEIAYKFDIIDYKPFPTGKLAEYKEDEIPGIGEKLTQADEKTFVYKSDDMHYKKLFGIYDWTGNGTIDEAEVYQTCVNKFDKYPFGRFEIYEDKYAGIDDYYVIYPDNKIYRFLINENITSEQTFDIVENSIFTDGNYIAIDLSKYPVEIN